MASTPEIPSPPVPRRRNVLVWLGFLVCLFAFLSYVPIFAKYPVTRDIPWVNLLLFAIGLIVLVVGWRRAITAPAVYRGKVSGAILGVLSLAALIFFCFGIFHFSKNLPASAQAPRVGQKAPDFTLADSHGATVTLASILAPTSSRPAKGVLLVFYRGYW
jgi:hypothetical protein